MPEVRERLSTSCTKDLIGRRSESFPGSKEAAVEVVVVVEEEELVKAVDNVDDDDVCCAMDGVDWGIGDNCSPPKTRGCF